MKTFNVAKSPKCQEEMRKILEAHELIYNLFLEFAKRSKTFDDNPAFTQSLQTALKLVRNKKITWTYGMFLKSTYDVFYLIDIFKELYTPEIQEKMDLVTDYLTRTLVVGGSEKKKLFEAVGEKENNPMPAYGKLDDVMWVQSLMQRYLDKVGASTSRDFLYKIHRYRKKRALKRLKKKTKRLTTDSDETASSRGPLKPIRGVSVDEDDNMSTFEDDAGERDEDSISGVVKKIQKLPRKAKLSTVDYEASGEGDRGSFSSFEEDDYDPLTVRKQITTLEPEIDFDRMMNVNAMEEGMSSFEENAHEADDPLAPGQRPTSLELPDRKPDINVLNQRLERLRGHAEVPETDPLDITHPQPTAVPEPEEAEPAPPIPIVRRSSDVQGVPMAAYIFSDSNMDIYSAKLDDERRESTSLTLMQDALNKISSSPQHKVRPFGVIDSMLSKLNSNVSLLGKMNKRSILSDHNVILSNDKIKSIKSDDQGRIDVILKLDPTVTKVGPINVYHKNRSFVYRCKVEDCKSNFYTLNLDLLQRHVLAEHVRRSFTDWQCSDCGYLRMVDPGIRGIMKHLNDSHSLEGTSQIAVGRLKSLNETLLKDIQSSGDCPVLKVGGPDAADACCLFQCCVPSCTFSSESVVQAINHFNVKLDGQVEYSCKYCPNIVTTAYEYAKHLVKRHGQSQYKCGFCYYRGATKATIYFHQSFSHPVMAAKIFRCRLHPPFEDDKEESKFKRELIQCRCPHCRFNTTIIEKFVRHLTEMHPGQKFNCFLCGECITMPQRIAIVDHLLKHDICEFQCLFCERGFTNVTSVRKHFTVDHPEKYPFVIVRHDYFGKSPLRAQYNRTREIPLGFESILGVDLGSNSFCENQIEVIDITGTGTEKSDYEDVSKKFEYYFTVEKGFISLCDYLPKTAALTPTTMAIQPTTDQKIKQTARKKTTPSPLKLVPLSQLINDPKPPVNVQVKGTARKSTRPSLPPPVPQSIPKSQSLSTAKPSFTKPKMPVFKIKQNVGKVHSAYAPSNSQASKPQKKISILSFKTPANPPPMSSLGPKKPLPFTITRLPPVTSAAPLKTPLAEGKQTARKHTGGSMTTTMPTYFPSTMSTPPPSSTHHLPQTVCLPSSSSSSGTSTQLKNLVRVINVSSRLPMNKSVSILRKGTTPSTVVAQPKFPSSSTTSTVVAQPKFLPSPSTTAASFDAAAFRPTTSFDVTAFRPTASFDATAHRPTGSFDATALRPAAPNLLKIPSSTQITILPLPPKQLASVKRRDVISLDSD